LLTPFVGYTGAIRERLGYYSIPPERIPVYGRETNDHDSLEI
jgi:hypothetical protein